MKKLITFVAAICLSTMANAQVIAELGFEDGDTKYTTDMALTPGGTFGDWVNKKATDEWDETNIDDPHTGEHAFYANNDPETTANTWDRGFKVGNLKLEDNTSYRVSFWVKANSDARISTNLGCGIEYVDAPICADGNIGYTNTLSGFNGEWKHVSYMTYFSNKQIIDEFFTTHVTSTDYIQTYADAGITVEEFTAFPERYFLTINMYTNTEYSLDDIVIEKALVNSPTFCAGAIRLDYGYATNLKSLLVNAGGELHFDTSCIKVTRGNELIPVEYLEVKSDGYIYAFLPEDVSLEPTDEIYVSFTAPEDVAIMYNTVKRPEYVVAGADPSPVNNFEGERAYYDDSFEDVLPDAWNPATMVSSVPEDGSFEIESGSLKSVSVTYSKKVALSSASSYIESNGIKTDLSSSLSLSEDAYTVSVALPSLADGEYTVVFSSIENEFGVPCTSDQKIGFQIGTDEDTTSIRVIYQSDFDNDMTGGVPPGWLCMNANGAHQYGFNDEAQTSQYNYNWGGTPGGGGARLYEGFSGDFKKAMYWCSRETEEGYCTYGELVKDYLDSTTGKVTEDAPEGIELWLEPGKHQISFRMAAWKSEPLYDFSLEDLDGAKYAIFEAVLAQPNMNGQTGAVSGSVLGETTFTVSKAGYYVLRFQVSDQNTDKTWKEFLLANVKLQTMPSNAAYYKSLLKTAVAAAKEALALGEDESYNGDTKTALAAEITTAETGHFTSKGQVEAEIAKLEALSAALQTRIENIDNFSIAILEGQIALEELQGTKYENTPEYTEASALVNKYIETDPTSLSDDELNTVAPTLGTLSGKLNNAKAVADRLSWRGYKAYQVANKLGQGESAQAQAAINLVEDNDAVVDAANVVSRQALYAILAEKGAVPAEILDTVRFDNGEYEDDEAEDPVYKIAVVGLDFTSLIKNPKFYTFATENNAADDTTFPGWSVEQINSTNGNLHFNGTVCSDTLRASSVFPNNWLGDYSLTQQVKNMPVGVYTVFLRTRTCTKSVYIGDAEEPTIIEGNAQNDETGLWDKYIFAQPNNGDKMYAKFQAGDMDYATGGMATVIANVEVKDEGNGVGTLELGAVEEYLSGKNVYTGGDWDWTGEDCGAAWYTNTFLGDARIYFTAPLAGYNYATAIENVAKTETTGVARYIYTPAGTRVSQMQKGVNIVKYSDGTTGKVLVK